jgi:hypothetical protein
MLDKDLCHKIGTIGRGRAEMMFDSKKTAQSILRLYKSL